VQEYVDSDPSWWDKDSCLVAIDLGYDEGGSGDKLLVSVQIGITEQAKKLKRKWKLPGGLPYFHSKDFGVYNGGVFTKAGLGRKARERLVGQLGTAIRQHLLFAVTARISISQYESLTSQLFRSKYGTAYGFAVNACLLCAYGLVTDHGHNPEFNILIERGHRNAEQIAQILEGLQKVPAEVQRTAGDNVIPDLRILTTGLGEKKDHPILQAADMVAYSEWQGLRRADPTIWNAINRGSGPYHTGRVLLGAEAIKMFASEGANSLIRKQRKRAKFHDGKQGISEVRSGDEYSPSSRPKSGESCDGDGDAD
jgi:hypothetical protein